MSFTIHQAKRRGNFKHGHRKGTLFSPEYESWACMKTRCLNPNCAAYRIYGGRGIQIDPLWMDFKNFLKDMGKRPSKAHSLERKDNSKGYTAENCKWATRLEQSANRRTNRFISFQGITLMLKDWAIRTGIHRRTISSRIQLGWPIELALTVKPDFGNDLKKL